MTKHLGVGIGGSSVAMILAVLAMIAVLAVPLLHSSYDENLSRSLLMYAAMSLGWNFIGGYTGYVSFGNVVFFGLGAYVAAVVSARGVPDVFVAIPLAAAVAALFAGLVGLPLLRLRGHYFGIATLAVALAVKELIENVDALGGGSGLAVHQSSVFITYFYAMWLVCAVCLLCTWLIARSKLGYAMVAIRENEEAAAALGIDPTRYKVFAWMISGAMTASAGATFAFANGNIDPATVFGIDYNIFPIAMVILGGIGTVAGPLLGAFLLTAFNEVLWGHFPALHNLFFGLAIVLIVFFVPRGVMSLFGLHGGRRGFIRYFQAYRV
ncbi:MAG TPA: branched-chain amino acid ABC transporter permease [Candidatus Baltobacteraceae bacterium]|jgi:branched-chain amino acid transport system permease protein|nr:branched-chain amino acid ABC transporter permease [Candidatus Baltobacteraceae bacterium]